MNEKPGIMIVEDEQIIVAMMQQILKQNGYEVVAAVSNSEAAIHVLSNVRPDLILMDIHINGDLDGIDLALIINEQFHLPVIYLTAYSDKQTLERARLTESYGYLMKPFSDIELITNIEIALYKHNIDLKLKTSEEKYRLLVEQSSELIFSMDVHGVLTYMSPIAEKIIGYTVEEMTGKNFISFIYEADRRMMLERFNRLLDGELEPADFRVVTREGDIRWVQSSSRRIRVNGNVESIQGVIADVTGRKQAEDAVAASELRYRRLFESAKDGILILDADTGMIVDINPYLKEILGFSHEELVGKKVWDLGFLKDVIPNQDRFLELRRQEFIRYDDMPLEAASGKKIDVEFVSNVYLVKDKKIIQCNIRDITERKKARDERAFQNTLLLTQQDVSLDGILSVDNDGKVISYNHHFIEMWEIPEDVIASKSEDRIMQSIAEKIINPDEFIDRVKYLHSHIDERSNKETLLKDGRYFERFSAPMIGPDTKNYGRVWFFRDSSKRKQAVAALQESEEKFRSYTELAPDGIFVVDKTGRYIEMNKSACRITGFSREELENMSIGDLLPAESFDIGLGYFKSLLETGKVAAELWIKRKDGSKCWITLDAVRLTENRFLAFCKDITERKLAEKTISESSAKLELAMTTANMAWWEMDISSGNVIFNKRKAEMLGYTPEKFHHYKDFMALVHPDDYERVMNAMKGHIDGLFPRYETDYRIQTQNGEYKWFYDIGSIVEKDSDGLLQKKVVGIVLDITDRKYVEQELEKYQVHLEDQVRKRTEELEKAKEGAMAANRAKSIFLSSMSHEIRTPLNAILGFSQLILRDPSLSPIHREYLETVNRSGEHLLSLINEILEFSRIEAGKTSSLNPAVFNLHSMLKDLATMFQMKTYSKGLKLLVEYDKSLPEFILADGGKLRQILINLIGNAIKFTDEGGIAVRVRIDKKENGKTYLVAEVEDSGHGIEEKDIEKIFGLFIQTELGVKAGGAGLGLVLSRQFARLMDGDITVRSEPGKGSCFTMTAAVQEAAASTIKKESTERIVRSLKPGSAPCRVLVVDDEMNNRFLLKAFLVPAGFEVREAENGREAVELFMEWRPHVILMDLRMPVMNGYEAIVTIKNSEQRTESKIVAVTASAFKEDRQKVLDWGADEYLRKPFKANEIFDVIQKLVGVQYVYEEEPAVKNAEKEITLTPESLNFLPAGLMCKMKYSAVNLDYDALRVMFEQINETFPNVSEQLLRLLKAYKYDVLISLFDKSEKSHE